MKKEEIITAIGKRISSEILKEPQKVLSAEEALITGGIIDSFSLVDLALIVEDLYGVLITDRELNAETFDTLDQLADLILERISE
jgi:acyl carrier protein